MSPETTKYFQNPDVICREEPYEQWLFFNPETNQKRVTNVLGAFIWDLCDGAHDLAGIVTSVCAAFDGAAEDQVTEDARALLDAMIDEGFLDTQ